DLDTRFDGDLGRFSAHATVSGDTALAMWLVAGPDSEFTRVPLNRPIVLPTLLPLRLAFGEELKPGKTYSLRLFDPVLLAERDVAVTIAPESTLVVADSADYDSTAMAWVPVHFDTVRAFRIEQERGGVRASAWIDAAGHIVRVTSGGDGGFTMERSAFEIAYENFRRRDTARVARASASPHVGDIVATTALTAGARPGAPGPLRRRTAAGRRSLLLSRLGRGVSGRLGRGGSDVRSIPRRRRARAVHERRPGPPGRADAPHRAAQTRGAMIRLENLTKHYGSFVAVDDISLEVPPG